MIQRASKFPEQLGICPICKGQPTHVIHGTRFHSLECPKEGCNIRTGKYENLQEAVESWEAIPRHLEVL